jgi:hypothetical protein
VSVADGHLRLAKLTLAHSPSLQQDEHSRLTVSSAVFAICGVA